MSTKTVAPTTESSSSASSPSVSKMLNPNLIIFGIGAAALLAVGILWWKLSTAETQIQKLTQEVADLPTSKTVHDLQEEWARQFVAKQAQHEAALFTQLGKMQETVESLQSMLKEQTKTGCGDSCECKTGEDCEDCEDCEECEDCACQPDVVVEEDDNDMPAPKPEPEPETKEPEPKEEEAESKELEIEEPEAKEDVKTPNAFSEPEAPVQPPSKPRTKRKPMSPPEDSSMDLADDTE